MNTATTEPTGIIPKLYTRFSDIASCLQSPLLLVIRLYWGWQFFLTGKGKLEHLDKITGFFTNIGIPFPGFNAALTGFTECTGGLLLLFGLAARLISIPLTIILTVAYLTTELEAVKSIFSDPNKFLIADPFLFLLAVVIILVFGPGKFSIDALLAKKFGHRP
jgi:putative oxidoreductase